MHLTPSEQATLNFYEFEFLGRGYYHFEEVVDIEPPYVPFNHSNTEETPFIDDGKVPSLLRRVLDGFSNSDIKPIKEKKTVWSPKPSQQISSLLRFSISFPKEQEISHLNTSEFIGMLSFSEHPISFEISGSSEQISISIVCSERDANYIQTHLLGYFPKAIVQEREVSQLGFYTHDPIAIVDFGLEEEFMRPIETSKSFTLDPLTSIFSRLDSLKQDDLVLLQVIFKGVSAPWSSSMMNAVSDGFGGSFFSDSPEMLDLTKEKVSKPLFSCVMRIATQGKTEFRTQYLAKELIQSIGHISDSSFNKLIPLPNEGYLYENHLRNLYDRTSNRLGMILNLDELLTFFHYPSPSIHSAKLGVNFNKEKTLPEEAKGYAYVIGLNKFQGLEYYASLPIEARLKHTHIIGATGVGKSTLMANMILQDIAHNYGCVLFDPHGDILEDILNRIPEEKMKDVVLIDPFDLEFPVGFNLLSANTDAEKIVLSSDLVSAFKQYATAWGDNMTSVLSNAINTFLDSSKDATLIELKRFLIEESFRNSFLKSVEDQALLYYWKYEYPLVKKGITPLLTRIDTFLRPKIIRNMMAQTDGVNFKDCIEQNKIILIKLSQGLIGRENSYLLGSLFLSKIHQGIQSRQSLSKKGRHPYFIYIDEFQNLLTPSI